jgi:hypothetical protein
MTYSWKAPFFIGDAMYSTVEDLSRYRRRIIDDAVATFKGTEFFSGHGRPTEDIAMAVCEGLLDLLMEPEDARDPHVVRRFMEWAYNLIRKKSVKTDRTIEFLDTFEGIVKRPLNNAEDKDVDEFFELCREIVRQKHKELLRNPP